jgi:hypothetical protein
MSVGTTTIYDYGSEAAGLHFTITATFDGANTTFKVDVLTGHLDLNALYWSDGDTVDDDVPNTDLINFTGAKNEASLNMQGNNVVWDNDGNPVTKTELWDGGIKLSLPGLAGTSSTYLDSDPSTAAPDTYSFTVNGLNINDFPILGVRATSTSNPEGSIKWADEHPENPPPPPPPDAECFDGLSQGAWGSPLSGAGDWTGTAYHTTDLYDTVFGVDAFTVGVNDVTLLQSLSGGGGESALSKQATGALLNSSSDGEDTLTESYRFTTAEIIAAVQEVYDDGGFDATQAAQLQNLLEFWNIAPENNLGDGAHHPGELCDSDTTAIATTLTLAKGDGTVLAGGSFDGSIFEVLDTLHPNSGWVA